MSATPCRTCQGLINFVMTPQGRWRPVEVTFQELELAGDEIVAVQQNGSWTQTAVPVLRVLTVHSCPENPAWNLGRPRMRTVDEGTGEVTGGIEDDEATSLDWQEVREVERVAGWVRKNPVDAGYPCEECGADRGEPCRNAYQQVSGQVHRPRHIATYFDNNDPTQPWPPRRDNQRGVKIMREWLSNYADVLIGGASF